MKIRLLPMKLDMRKMQLLLLDLDNIIISVSKIRL
jgi:hypothetical protein